MFIGTGFDDRAVTVADMTRTRTVAKLTDGIPCGRTLCLLVRVAFEIAGVTAGAIRFICCKRPGDGLVIGSMAILALY